MNEIVRSLQGHAPRRSGRRALRSGDLEQFASLYADEAATRTTAGRVVHGTEQIREVLKGLLARKARFDGAVRWSVTVGDVALIIVDWTRQETAHDGNRERFSGTSTHVLRRQADGGQRLPDHEPERDCRRGPSRGRVNSLQPKLFRYKSELQSKSARLSLPKMPS